MTLRFYDTASASVRDFEPVVPGEASLYYCGATVQSGPHIGHVRSGLVFDILIRWLRFRGLKVTAVRNVTDIDDKILEKARASEQPGHDGDHPNEPWWALAYRFEGVFHQAYDALGIERPTYEPRATGHIPQMHELIAELIERGHAYPAQDGSGDVYFDVRSWPRYGELTHQRLDEMQEAADADPRGKRDPRDFALWKGHKEQDPLTASWDSPWGRGRPGWHLECSAMAGRYLGDRFDFHGGGLDLRFPHHENELAQSAAAGQRFASFWLHNGLVAYQGEKMSKSLGNTVDPQQMLAENRPLVVRYMLGQAHYRSVLDYRPTSLEEAAAAVERIEAFLGAASAAGADLDWEPSDIPADFVAVMDDDLNVSRALGVLHDRVRAGNTALHAGAEQGAELAEAARAVSGMSEILGLRGLMALGGTGTGAQEHEALDQLVQDLLERRAAARAAKDWAEADRLRDTLAEAGITVADGAEGSTWTLG